MSTDARLSTGLPGHPKTKKLVRRLGPGAGWSLVCLILWARANRSDGDLSGMSAEDIELAADWTGENDALVRELASVGFLDGTEGDYQLHDWAEHQPWSAGSEARSDRAKWSALCRRHGREEAARLMPEYAAKIAKSADPSAKSTDSPAISSDLAEQSPAKTGNQGTPSPIPSPSPSPIPSPNQEHSSSTAAPSTDLLGGKTATDIAAKRAERISTITADAIAAYNRILGKPNGLLRAVRASVGVDTRREQVKRCLKTASEICQDLYGDSRITPEFWAAYFESAAADDFSSGRGPYTGDHKDWRPDFEYLTRKTTMLKLFERAVDDEADVGAAA